MNKFKSHCSNTSRLTLSSVTLAALFALASSAQAQSSVSNDAMSNESTGRVGMAQSVKPIKRDKAVVYKQMMSDGGIVYADEPIKGYPVLKVIEVDLRSTATWAAKTDLSKDSPAPAPSMMGTPMAGDAEQKAAVNLTVQSKAQSDAQARLLATEERFNRANASLKIAETPLAGERSMNVNGTSRLNMGYFERQEKTKAQAQQAALEYDSALTAAYKTR